MWTLLAQILNTRLQPSITPRLLWSILAVCGHYLQRAYGPVFQRLVRVIASQVLPPLQAGGDAHDKLEATSLARLLAPDADGIVRIAAPLSATIPEHPEE